MDFPLDKFVEFFYKLTDNLKLSISVIISLISWLYSLNVIYAIITFCLSLVFLSVIQFFYKKHLHRKQDIASRKERLHLIMTDSKHHKEISEKDSLKFLYNAKLKKFGKKDLIKYLHNSDACASGFIEKIEPLAKFSQQGKQLLYFKDGKYIVYNDVWKELKSYKKNGFF